MLLRTPREIGLRIRDRRMQLGMSQAQLAERIGMSRQWVVSLEKGAPGAAMGTVLRAISELGLLLDLGEPYETSERGAGMMLREEYVPIRQIREFVDTVGLPARGENQPVNDPTRSGGARTRTPLRRVEGS